MGDPAGTRSTTAFPFFPLASDADASTASAAKAPGRVRHRKGRSRSRATAWSTARSRRSASSDSSALSRPAACMLPCQSHTISPSPHLDCVAAVNSCARPWPHCVPVRRKEREMEIQSSGRSIDVLMEKVLSVNILSSDYFEELYRLKTYHEVIDEIYNQVDHVEPWMTGNCRSHSSVFCLLYKLFTMKLTVK